MNIMGVDFAFASDNFGITVTEIQGSYKAPCAHDVVYIIKDFEPLYVAAVKERMPWNKKA